MNDRRSWLFALLRSLTALRTDAGSLDRHSFCLVDDVRDCIWRGFRSGYVTLPQANILLILASDALRRSSSSFPDARNAGPYMPDSIWYERHIAEGKLQAQVPANEKPESVSAPAPCRELRLLCLLVETASDSYAVPLGTMHPVPPRASIKGRWPSAGSPGFVLRQTHAQRPAAQVLARLQRHGQTNAIRATARTVQLGVTA